MLHKENSINTGKFFCHFHKQHSFFFVGHLGKILSHIKPSFLCFRFLRLLYKKWRTIKGTFGTPPFKQCTVFIPCFRLQYNQQMKRRVLICLTIFLILTMMASLIPLNAPPNTTAIKNAPKITTNTMTNPFPSIGIWNKLSAEGLPSFIPVFRLWQKRPTQ